MEVFFGTGFWAGFSKLGFLGGVFFAWNQVGTPLRVTLISRVRPRSRTQKLALRATQSRQSPCRLINAAHAVQISKQWRATRTRVNRLRTRSPSTCTRACCARRSGSRSPMATTPSAARRASRRRTFNSFNITLTSSPPAKVKSLHNHLIYSRFADAKERKRRKQPQRRPLELRSLQQQQQRQLRRVPPVQRWQARRKSSSDAAWTTHMMRKRLTAATLARRPSASVVPQ